MDFREQTRTVALTVLQVTHAWVERSLSGGRASSSSLIAVRHERVSEGPRHRRARARRIRSGLRLSGFTVAEARDATTASPELPRHVQVPSRAEQLSKLQQGTLQNPFDVLVIGGGATGTGCAVDATTRCAPPSTPSF